MGGAMGLALLCVGDMPAGMEHLVLSQVGCVQVKKGRHFVRLWVWDILFDHWCGRLGECSWVRLQACAKERAEEEGRRRHGLQGGLSQHSTHNACTLRPLSHSALPLVLTGQAQCCSKWPWP